MSLMKRPFAHCLSLFLVVGSLTVCSSQASEEKTAGIGSHFKGPIGLQLYSLRAEFIRYGVPETLKKVRDMGIRHVETAGTYNLPVSKFRVLLDKYELSALSAHFSYNDLRDNLDKVIEEANTLGVRYVGLAWIPHKDAFDEQECRDAIKVFNNAAKRLKREGFVFFYHPHGYEWAKHGDGTLFDLMAKETSEDVKFEMDVYWAHHAGQNPVKLMRDYWGRWDLMHLKDMKKGVETGITTGKSDVKFNVVLGTGQINWPAVLKMARKTKMELYLIEDESPRVEKQIPLTLKYLEGVEWK
jgi:sugar phosphate isomerase/epimerase